MVGSRFGRAAMIPGDGGGWCLANMCMMVIGLEIGLAQLMMNSGHLIQLKITQV